MRYLLLRSLPWLVGILGIFCFEWTWNAPSSYPWLLCLPLAAAVMSMFVIGWRKVSLLELIEKMTVPMIAYVTVALAALLVEQPVEQILITALGAGIPLLSLELLFLYAYQPSRYPVNAISRVNLALIPLSAFFLAEGLMGLQIFLTDPAWKQIADPVTIGTFIALGAILALLTSHPTSDRGSRTRWTLFGGLLGLHLGILCAILPVALPVAGCLVALGLAAPMRARRYGHDPKPPAQLAWAEGTFAFVLFLTLMLVSKWA
ncbi:MAG TPA: hypothetical protein VMU11_01425 [Verrucomicrobiae bacterium]|nr:hypothetical protein [Verrucomicrobiae bacterium]